MRRRSVRVGEQPDERVREQVGRAPAAPAARSTPCSTSSGHAHDLRRDDRELHRHRLHQDDRDALGEARQAEDVGLGVERAHPVVRDARRGSGPRRAIPSSRGAASRNGALGAVARERQPRVGDLSSTLGERLEQDDVALAARQRGDAEDLGRRRSSPSARSRRKAARSTPQRTVCSFASVAGSASAATWLRAKSLMQTTAAASATFAASLWASTSRNSVGPWIVMLHVQRGVGARPVGVAAGEQRDVGRDVRVVDVDVVERVAAHPAPQQHRLAEVEELPQPRAPAGVRQSQRRASRVAR